jgi:hypothetical protein
LGSIQKTKEPCDKIEKNSIKTYFVTKSSFIGLKNNLSLFVLLVSILFILGWVLSILMFLSPISLATFTKKLLNISVTSFGSFTILSFSHKIMLLFDFIPLFDKKGLMELQMMM